MAEHAHIHRETQVAATRLRAALEAGDLDAFGALLDDNVRWGGEEETPQTCHTRAEVLNRLRRQRDAGVDIQVLEVTPGHDGVVAGFHVKQSVRDGFGRESTVYQLLEARGLVPILNVSDLAASFEWFRKLGWSQHWDWRPSDASPPTFGAVHSAECE